MGPHFATRHQHERSRGSPPRHSAYSIRPRAAPSCSRSGCAPWAPPSCFPPTQRFPKPYDPPDPSPQRLDSVASRQRLDFCLCPMPSSHSWYLLHTRLTGEPAPAPLGARALARYCTCFFLATAPCTWGQQHCHVCFQSSSANYAARCCWCGDTASCQRLDFFPRPLPSSHSWYLLRTRLSGEPAPAPFGARALTRYCMCFALATGPCTWGQQHCHACLLSGLTNCVVRLCW